MGVDLQGPSLPHQVTDPVDQPPPNLELSASLPHSHQKGGLTQSPVTNSCPTLFQYISKNVPATDHVIRRETETTFSGSHSCSPSHHCSTATPTSSHRWAPPGSPHRHADSCTRTHRERGHLHHTPAWGHAESPARLCTEGPTEWEVGPQIRTHCQTFIQTFRGSHSVCPKPAPEE